MKSVIKALVSAILTIATLLTITTGHAAGQERVSAAGDYHFIRNMASGKVLDIEGGSTQEGAAVILWDKRDHDNDNQLWKFTEGLIVNKKSGLSLEITMDKSGSITIGKGRIVQAAKREPAADRQRWKYNDEHQLLSFLGEDELCLSGAKGDVQTPGNNLVINFVDGTASQQWMFDSP